MYYSTTYLKEISQFIESKVRILLDRRMVTHTWVQSDSVLINEEYTHTYMPSSFG